MQNSEKNPKPPCLLKTSFLFYMTLYFMIVRQSAPVYFWALSRERRRFFALCSLSIKSAAFWVRNQSGLGVKLTAGRPPAVTKTVATLFSANPAVRWVVKKVIIKSPTSECFRQMSMFLRWAFEKWSQAFCLVEALKTATICSTLVNKEVKQDR